jgi:hypothetical protein
MYCSLGVVVLGRNEARTAIGTNFVFILFKSTKMATIFVTEESMTGPAFKFFINN